MQPIWISTEWYRKLNSFLYGLFWHGSFCTSTPTTVSHFLDQSFINSLQQKQKLFKNRNILICVKLQRWKSLQIKRPNIFLTFWNNLKSLKKSLRFSIFLFSSSLWAHDLVSVQAASGLPSTMTLIQEKSRKANWTEKMNILLQVSGSNEHLDVYKFAIFFNVYRRGSSSMLPSSILRLIMKH